MFKIYIYGLLLGLTTLLFFQNCSKTDFSVTDDKMLTSRCSENPLYSDSCYNQAQETHIKSLTANPTDILFVLDDSCSMETIANQVRDGFNSLLTSQFPANTKMAVTYMSPAYVKDDDTVDYLLAHPVLPTETQNFILASAGHMQLVQRNTIANYKSRISTDLISDTTALNYYITVVDFKKLYPGVNHEDPSTGLRLHTDGLRILTKYNPAYPLSDIKRNTIPNALEVKRLYLASKLSLEGCDKDWFDPNEKESASSNACLSAAVQLVPVCTGIEAGIVSLAQTLQKYTAQSQKLFRDNAKVNIVLISDTHESGYVDATTGAELYFGSIGGPKNRLSQADLQSLIHQNNALVSSIKIHGIIPLPEQGNPLLDGLSFISGLLPQTPEESVINGEGVNGFAYLPYIKETKGVVAHAANNNWSDIADDIVKSADYSGSLLVTLKQKAKKILSVKVNDVAYDTQNVVLSTDGRSFSLTQENNSKKDLKIFVTYELDVPVPL